MANEGRIDLAGLPRKPAGNLDAIAGVDTATNRAALFPVEALPMPQGVASAIQQQNAEIEAIRGSQGSGLPSYATRAALPAPGTLPRPAGGGDPLVTVTNDPTAANNGAWRDTGSEWVKSADRVTGLEGRVGAVESNAVSTVPGKNLLDKSKIRRGFLWTNGSNSIIVSTSGRVSPFIPVIEGTSYRVSGNQGAQTGGWFTAASDDAAIGPTGSTSAGPITAPPGAKFLAFNITNQGQDNLTYDDTVQVEVGTTATAYEPYRRLVPSDRVAGLDASLSALSQGVADAAAAAADVADDVTIVDGRVNGVAAVADAAASGALAASVSQALEMTRAPDLVAHFSGLALPDELYVRKITRDRVERLCVAYRYGSRIAEYAFADDIDGLRLLKEAHVGPLALVAMDSKAVPVERDGNYAGGSSNNWYASSVGATISGSFTGVGLTFNTYTDNRGGMWEFVIDGGPPVQVSVWSSSINSEAKFVVADGLEHGPHTFVATYIGADPEHTPAAGGPRGWLKWHATDPMTAIARVDRPVLAIPENMPQPDLIGDFTFPTGNDSIYTTNVGAQMAFSFSGTRLEFQSLRESRGGMWHFEIDGGAPIPVSTYSAATSTDWIEVAAGLSPGAHDVVATFMGDDPSNPPSSSPSRGWLKYNREWPMTFRTDYRAAGMTRQILVPVIHEWAINARPTDEAGWGGWSPSHGDQVVSRNVQQQVKIDGSVVNVADLPSYYIPCKAVEIVQTYDNYSPQDTAATKRLWSGKLKHQATARGSIAVFHSLLTARPLEIATGYLGMLGGTESFDEAGNNAGERVTPATPVSGEEAVDYTDIGASDAYMAISSEGYVAVLRTSSPEQLWQDGLAPNTRRFFVNTRAGETVKTYMQGVGSATWPANRFVQTVNEYWVGER